MCWLELSQGRILALVNPCTEIRARQAIEATRDGNSWLEDQLIRRLEARKEAIAKIGRYDRHRRALERGGFAGELGRQLFKLCCVPQSPSELEETVGALNRLLAKAAPSGESRTKWIDPAIVVEYYSATERAGVTVENAIGQPVYERAFLQTYLVETLRRPTSGPPRFSDERARQWIELLEDLELASRSAAVTRYRINQNAKVVNLLVGLMDLLEEWMSRQLQSESMPIVRADHVLHFCAVRGSIGDATHAEVASELSEALRDYAGSVSTEAVRRFSVALPRGVEGVAVALGTTSNPNAYLIVVDSSVSAKKTRKVLLHELDHLRRDLEKTEASHNAPTRGRPKRAF